MTFFSLAAHGQAPASVDCPLSIAEGSRSAGALPDFTQPVDRADPSVGTVQIPVAISIVSARNSSSALSRLGGAGRSAQPVQKEAGKRESFSSA